MGLDGAGGVALLTRRDEKKRLRDANADLARELVRRTGMSHPQVNAELNRLAGVKRVTEATAAQLKTRLDVGDRWLRKA